MMAYTYVVAVRRYVFGAPRDSPQHHNPGDLGRSAGTRARYDILPHPEQGHQATFALLPANLTAVLREQLLAGVTDRLTNPSMRCSTWRGNNLKVEQTVGSTLGLSEIQTADTPPVHIIIHG